MFSTAPSGATLVASNLYPSSTDSGCMALRYSAMSDTGETARKTGPVEDDADILLSPASEPPGRGEPPSTARQPARVEMPRMDARETHVGILYAEGLLDNMRRMEPAGRGDGPRVALPLPFGYAVAPPSGRARVSAVAAHSAVRLRATGTRGSGLRISYWRTV